MLLTAGFARYEGLSLELVSSLTRHRADIAALDGYTVIVNHKWEQLG